MKIQIKKVYEPVEKNDGLRIFADRFWPRGMKKAELPYDIWAKNITPSDNLRQLFHQNPEKNWDVFCKDYKKELETSADFTKLIKEIMELNPSCVTLLYAFRNREKNHAVILQNEMEKYLK